MAQEEHGPPFDCGLSSAAGPCGSAADTISPRGRPGVTSQWLRNAPWPEPSTAATNSPALPESTTGTVRPRTTRSTRWGTGLAPKGVHFSHEGCYLLLKRRHPRISVRGRVHTRIESQSNGRVALVQTLLAGVGRAFATPGMRGNASRLPQWSVNTQS